MVTLLQSVIERLAITAIKVKKTFFVLAAYIKSRVCTMQIAQVVKKPHTYCTIMQIRCNH